MVATNVSGCAFLTGGTIMHLLLDFVLAAS